MISRRRCLAVATAAVAATVLVGCAPSAEPSDSQGPVTLTYWDFLDPSQDNPRAKALKENIANFEAANPNIKVNLSVVSLGDMLNRLPEPGRSRTVEQGRASGLRHQQGRGVRQLPRRTP